MNRKLIILFLAIFLIPSFAAAEEIALHQDLKARAAIVKSNPDGLWEKTLVIQFPQERRTLSTNDGVL
ncbi:MAG: hypothetical protein ABRQ30_05735, partial [Smithellaceae bacterium]